MERIVNISKNFKEAEEWDIEQYLLMTPTERQKIAKTLKKRFYKIIIPLKIYYGRTTELRT